MTLESLAIFLIEHPDWAPVLQENLEIFGVTGPTGGFVPLETLEKILAAPSYIRARLFRER